MTKITFEGNQDDWIEFINQSKLMGLSGSARIRAFIKEELKNQSNKEKVYFEEIK